MNIQAASSITHSYVIRYNVSTEKGIDAQYSRVILVATEKENDKYS